MQVFPFRSRTIQEWPLSLLLFNTDWRFYPLYCKGRNTLQGLESVTTVPGALPIPPDLPHQCTQTEYQHLLSFPESFLALWKSLYLSSSQSRSDVPQGINSNQGGFLSHECTGVEKKLFSYALNMITLMQALYMIHEFSSVIKLLK